MTKALPKVAKVAKSAELRQAAEEHLEETKEQIAILEEVFKSLELKPTAEKCDAIEGLIKEADGILKKQAERRSMRAYWRQVKRSSITEFRGTARYANGRKSSVTRRSHVTATDSRSGKTHR